MAGTNHLSSQFTPKGIATRARIVATAADLILARGVGGTSLDDVRLSTLTSKSQLFHYFPGGKSELISAIAAFQGERVLQAQRPHLDALDTWAAWRGWRDAVICHYGAQPHWGCPIGSLASELAGREPERAAEVAVFLNRWRGYLEAGLRRMRISGLLRPDADPEQLALAIFAALQGGLLLTQIVQSIDPLVAALDGALAMLREAAHSTDEYSAVLDVAGR
jgi:AcrR family transcriptional regulator